MKKILLVLLSISLCISLGTSPAFALDNSDSSAEAVVSEDTMINYLITAGYPLSVIQSLNEVAISEIYYGQYEYQTSSVIYGIFTEDYNITYELDNSGNVIIDTDNLLQFNELLNDEDAINKISADKDHAFECRKAMNRSQDYYINDSGLQSNISSRDAAIRSLSNWYATLTINKISQSNTKLEKSIIYAWNWFYSPVWNLTDKPAVAWSKDFTLDPNSTTWAYKAWGDLGYDVTGGSRRTTRTWSGTGCTEYQPDCGFGQSIDIRFEFDSNGWTYRTYEHGGSISGKLTKYLVGSEQGAQNIASAVGRYYHKQVGITGTLGFSKSGPSISISWASSYDPSPDTGAQFNFYQ